MHDLHERGHGRSVVDLIQLRYFQAVARHQHVSRAAEELGVAQPALSRSIGRLEAELGIPLFDRRGRRVVLNRFGALFLSRVGNALGQLEQGRRQLQDAASLARGSVAVAAETPATGSEPWPTSCSSAAESARLSRARATTRTRSGA